MAKTNKVEVQKGKIQADVRTMKSMTRKEVDQEDAKYASQRRDGMILKFHSPKR